MATLIGVLVLVGVIALLVATRMPRGRYRSGSDAHWLWADGDRHDAGGGWSGGGDFGGGGDGGGGGG